MDHAQDEITYKLRSLGPLTATYGSQSIDLGGPKQKVLLALLLINADRIVSVDQLIDGLWGEDPPASARKGVQMHVSNLRRALGPEFPLKTAPGGYLIQADSIDYDVADFERSVRSATERLRIDPAAAATSLAEALATWNGAPFADLSAEPSLYPEIARLGELRLTALERRLDADLRAGRHTDVVAELETLTRDHPFHERFREQQMLALYRSGRQSEALMAYDRARTELVEQLGLEPSPPLQTLRDQILQHSTELEFTGSVGEPLAFIFTDLEDSTAHWESDPEAMHAALARHDEILDEAVTANAGTVFKNTGDGILAVFADAGEAMRAALDAQAALAREAWPTAAPLRVRMAVDVGQATARDGDYFGPVLNRVSRVMASGHGGQVLIPSEIERFAPGRCRSLGTADYKGIGRIAVSQLEDRDAATEFPPLRTDRTPIALARSGFSRSIRGYELREQLGEGAFGIVYRAYQASIGREVAIKVIRPEFANRTEFIKRFEAEAQYVAQLEHPHIAPLYDYWREPDGAYLVMQLLRGGSLAGSLERSPWRPPAALALLGQVGAALDYAHRHGVVHRDLKPANVLLDADGNAFLSDFGIATQHVEAQGLPIESSVAYLSPEELAGHPVGIESDMYGFTLLAYEVLTGARPALGDSPAPVAEQRPDLPPAIDRILARGANANPSERYARIDDFLRELRQAFGIDAMPSSDPVATGPIRNPFKGLRSFREIDAEDFFGREDLVDELLDHVTSHRFTAVVGPSGSGKSSVVRAGLLPAIRRGALGIAGDTLITDMYPGTYPFEELESALVRVAVEPMHQAITELLSDDRGLLRVTKQLLPNDDSELLLVIDQFEELFSLTTDDEARRKFLSSLVEVVSDERSRVRIVITLRADYFDRPLADPSFGALLRKRVISVAMPNDHDLAEAIARPASAAGIEFETGLIPRIIRDVADEPGALPLMQYALTQLVEQRDGSMLTSDAYEQMGGISGALTTRAEEIYESLSGSARDTARAVFTRLVRVDEQADDTRRRARRSELDSLDHAEPTIDSVIATFGSFRLLSFDRDPQTRGQTIEVAHEALIREWPRLREWIDAERESLLIERRLEAASVEWDQGGRPDNLLTTGGRLEQFERWAVEHRTAIPDPQQAFLSDSRQLTDDVVRRRSTVRRRVLALVASLAVLAGVAAGVAWIQGAEARQQRDLALEQERIARSAEEEARQQRSIADDNAAKAETERIAAEAASLAGKDLPLSLLLAVEAHHRDPGPVGLGALQQALSQAGSFLGLVHHSGAHGVRWLDDDRTVVVGPEGTSIVDRSGATTELDGTPVNERVVAAGDANVRIISTFDAAGTVVAFARADDPTVVEMIDTTGRTLGSVDHDSAVDAVALTDDGARLLTLDFDGWLTATDTNSGRELWRVAGHPETSEADIDWPDDAVDPLFGRPKQGSGGPLNERPQLIQTDLLRGTVTTLEDALLRQWDLDSGELVSPDVIIRPVGTDGPTVAGLIDDFTLSPGGDRFVGVSNTAIFEGATDGTDLGRLLPAETATSYYSTPKTDRVWWDGGDLALVLFSDGRLGEVDWSTGELVNDLVTGLTDVADFDVSPDGSSIVFASNEGVGFWSRVGDGLITSGIPRQGTHVGHLLGDDIVAANYSLVKAASWQPAVWWDDSGPSPVRIETPTDELSPDWGLGFRWGDNAFLSMHVSYKASIWNLETRQRKAIMDMPGSWNAQAASPDGMLGAFGTGLQGTSGPGLTIFSTEDGSVVEVLAEPGSGARSMSFSPDGKVLATVGADNIIRLYETDGWELLDIAALDGETTRAIRFSADGRFLVTLEEEGDVTLRNTADYMVDKVLLGPGRDTVTTSDAFFFDETGQYLITSSGRLWDLEDGTLVGVAFPNAPDFRIGGKDGFELLTASNDHILRWNLDFAAWPEIACQAAGRNMTINEWDQFGPSGADYRATCPQWPLPENA